MPEKKLDLAIRLFRSLSPQLLDTKTPKPLRVRSEGGICASPHRSWRAQASNDRIGLAF